MPKEATNFYKLRHTPSGLFFKPSKHRDKANLSLNGKVYQKRPSLNSLSGSYTHPEDDEYNRTQWRERGFTKRNNRRVVPTEWEIVQYAIVPVKAEPCR